jgi:hypothetical protein
VVRDGRRRVRRGGQRERPAAQDLARAYLRT